MDDEVDLFGIYCGDLDRCFLVPAAVAVDKHALSLRLSDPRNGQRACINLASSFDFEGAIAQLGERVTGSHEVVGSSPTSSIALPGALIDADKLIEVQDRSYASAGQGLRRSWPTESTMDGPTLCELLEQHTFCVLASADAKGRAQARPVAFTVLGSSLWFATVGRSAP